MNCGKCKNKLSFFSYLLTNEIKCKSCNHTAQVKTVMSDFLWSIIGGGACFVFFFSLVTFESIIAPFIVFGISFCLIVALRYKAFQSSFEKGNINE